MRTEETPHALSKQILPADLIEALTALELNSEASRIHLGSDVPNLHELRRLNRTALRDVECIVQVFGQMRQASGDLTRNAN